MLSIEIGTVQGRPGPERALLLSGNIKWYAEDAYLIALEGKLSLNQRIVSDKVYLQQTSWTSVNGRAVGILRRDSNLSGTLVAPLSTEAIKYIEEQTKGQDVSLKLDLRYQYQQIVPWDDPPTRRNFRLGAEVFWLENPANLEPIPLSEWLKRLKEMEWKETQLFEVDVLPLQEDKNLAQALQLLQQAETYLRSGNWKDTIAKCRSAFESAAKYESQGDVKRGFDALLARAFPEHEKKPSVMNDVIKALSEYAHTLGRHEQYPALQVWREEAEFVFTSTVSLFSLLSRRLKERGEDS